MSTGSSYYDNVRPLAYPDSDAVLICFDISRPETLDSVIKKVSIFYLIFSSRHFGSAFNMCCDSGEPTGKKIHFVLLSIFCTDFCAGSLHFHGSTMEQISTEVRASHSESLQNVHGYLTLVPLRNTRSEWRMRLEALLPGGFERNIRYAN